MPRSTALFGPKFRGEGQVRGDILDDPRYAKTRQRELDARVEAEGRALQRLNSSKRVRIAA